MSDSYKPSGRVGALCIPMTLVIGVAAALVGGYVYQKIVDFVPFIYINFLLTLGLGFGIAMVLNFTLTRGKCRNVMLAAVLAVVCGGVAVAASFYANYQGGLSELADEAQRQSNAAESEFVEGDAEEVIATLIPFGTWIELRVEHGWEIMGALTLSGVLVWIIWLIELGILVGCPLVVGMAAAYSPFCEPCTAWTDDHPVGTTSKLTVQDIDHVRGATDIAPYLGVEPSTGDRNLVFLVHACPTCEVTRFAQVNETWQEPDGKGGVKAEDNSLLLPLRLGREDAERLLAKFKDAPPEAPSPPPPPPTNPSDWHSTEGTG